YSMYIIFSSRRRHTISKRDWSSDVCSSDLYNFFVKIGNKAEVHSHRSQYDLTTLYYKLITNLVIIYENTGSIAILNVQLFYFFMREAMEILLLLSLPF